MLLIFSGKSGNPSCLRGCGFLYFFWVTLLINFTVSSPSTTKDVTVLDANSPISLHSAISNVSHNDDDGLLDGGAMKSKVARRRRVLVYVEGKVLCGRNCMNSTKDINPLHGTRVKVECKSSYGEYKTHGISNRDGVFRVIIHGALGYKWPLRFCKARVLLDTVPHRCRPSRTYARNNSNEFNMNMTLKYNLPAKIMLGAGPFIFKPANISALEPKLV